MLLKRKREKFDSEQVYLVRTAFFLLKHSFFVFLLFRPRMNIAERTPSWKAYPPVPNWYSSNVTAIVEPDLFLYASKNIIVCLVLKDLSYLSSFAVTSEKEKIMAIAAHDLVCFTAGTDKVVRGWNMTLGTMITAHVEHKVQFRSMFFDYLTAHLDFRLK